MTCLLPLTGVLRDELMEHMVLSSSLFGLVLSRDDGVLLSTK